MWRGEGWAGCMGKGAVGVARDWRLQLDPSPALLLLLTLALVHAGVWHQWHTPPWTVARSTRQAQTDTSRCWMLRAAASAASLRPARTQSPASPSHQVGPQHNTPLIAMRMGKAGEDLCYMQLHWLCYDIPHSGCSYCWELGLNVPVPPLYLLLN